MIVVRTNLLQELEREFLPLEKKEIPWSKVFFILILGAVMGVSLWGLYFYLKGSPSAARFFGLSIPVETVTVKGEALTEIIGASGKTEPAATMEITSSMSGKVLSVPVDIGAVVSKGQALAQLDPAPFKAALQLAQEKFARAKTNFEKSELFEKRMNELFARKLISSTELGKATREKNTAHAYYSDTADGLVTAKDNLDKVVITAQAPGMIMERKIKLGQIITPNESLFIVGTTESVRVVVTIPQETSEHVITGQEADLVLDAYPNIILTGVVEKIDPITSPPSGNGSAAQGVRVSIRVKSDIKIKIGIPSYAWIKSHRKGLTIPKFSVIQPSKEKSPAGMTTPVGQAAVFVVEDLRAHLRPIRTGVTRKNKVEVLEGLTEGEEVVSVGLLDIRDNDRVQLKGYRNRQ